MDAKNSSNMEKSNTPRHTPHQIQQLEASFEDCPYPNENQRKELSRQLGLEKNQVKFWFQNKRNQKKHERISNESRTRKRISYLSMPPESFAHLMSLPAKHFFGQQSESSSINPCINSINSYNPIAAGKPIAISEVDKILMVRKASYSLNEFTVLLKYLDPLWVMSPTYGGFVLHDGNYSKIFSKSRHLRSWSSRIESSKEMAEVPIAASELVEMFLDMRKWSDLYPTIVMEAKIIETLSTENIGGGSLYLMYERTHILSSLVAPREFVFLRYFKQLSTDTWLIMDTSYDFFKENQHMPLTHSWMFPSGVKIESLPNEKSMVTWVNHVEFNESLTDPLYRNLLSSIHGYGAKRWISTLERMIERSQYYFSPGSTIYPELEEGMNNFESRKNIMALSHRMIKDYCAILSMPERSNLSVPSEYKIKMSLSDNNEPGQPHGTIISASTSIWVPVIFENLFNFLRDHHKRPEWDLTLNRSEVVEIAHMPTGGHPGNRISVFKPCISEKQHKLFLQENSIDPSGAFIVFAGLESSEIIKAVMKGEDSSKIPILPCGFSISDDRGPFSASTSSIIGSSKPLGSLVTLAFQLRVESNTGEQTLKKASNNLNNFVISVIQNLKVAIGCFKLD